MTREIQGNSHLHRGVMNRAEVEAMFAEREKALRELLADLRD